MHTLLHNIGQNDRFLFLYPKIPAIMLPELCDI